MLISLASRAVARSKQCLSARRRKESCLFCLSVWEAYFRPSVKVSAAALVHRILQSLRYPGGALYTPDPAREDPSGEVFSSPGELRELWERRCVRGRQERPSPGLCRRRSASEHRPRGEGPRDALDASRRGSSSSPVLRRAGRLSSTARVTTSASPVACAPSSLRVSPLDAPRSVPHPHPAHAEPLPPSRPAKDMALPATRLGGVTFALPPQDTRLVAVAEVPVGGPRPSSIVAVGALAARDPKD